MTELTHKLERFEAALAPLVDMALSQGISVNDLQRVMRQLFVVRAAASLRQRGEPTSIARLAVASGATRNEVRSALTELEVRQSARTSGARLRARIPELLSIWTSDPRFSGPYGAVRNLFLREPTQSGEQEGSFAALTNSVDPQIDPAEAADLLVDAGCATWVDANRQVLRFEKVTFISGHESASDQHFQHSMRMLAGAARTTAANLKASDRSGRLLYRAVVADNPLGPAEAKALFEYAESNFGQALSQADQFISALPPAAGERGRQYGIGVFVFEDEPFSSSFSEMSLIEPEAHDAMRAEA